MKLKATILSLIAIAILASCSTSNNVVGGGIQKRKYNDGYYVSGGRKFDHKLDAQKIESLLIDADNEIAEKTSATKEKSDVSEELANIQEEITTTDASTEPEIEEVQDVEKTESNHNGISQPANITNIESTPADYTVERKHTFKTVKTVVSDAAASDTDILILILLVILCFILPPLAVGIFEGITARFWIDLILWLLGWGVGFWLLGGLGWICSLVAVILALLIVLSVI